MNILENINDIGKKLTENLNFENLQNNFLKSDIAQVANGVLDMSLRALLPDYLENEVINVKNSFLYEGFEEGINSAVDNAINVGKKLLGMENMEFKSIGQAQETLEKGDLMKNISNNLNSTINKVSNSKNVSNTASELLNDNKEIIKENIKNEISEEFINQSKNIEKIEKYIGKWEEAYRNKDLEGLNKQYKKIENIFKNLLPLENIINNVHKIQNINELIKNLENFDFNLMYLDLAKNI